MIKFENMGGDYYICAFLTHKHVYYEIIEECLLCYCHFDYIRRM